MGPAEKTERNELRHYAPARLGEIHDGVLGRESRELPNCLAVGAACIRVADMRVEEVARPVSGFRTHREGGVQGRATRLER